MVNSHIKFFKRLYFSNFKQIIILFEQLTDYVKLLQTFAPSQRILKQFWLTIRSKFTTLIVPDL